MSNKCKWNLCSINDGWYIHLSLSLFLANVHVGEDTDRFVHICGINSILSSPVAWHLSPSPPFPKQLMGLDKHRIMHGTEQSKEIPTSARRSRSLHTHGVLLKMTAMCPLTPLFHIEFIRSCSKFDKVQVHVHGEAIGTCWLSADCWFYYGACHLFVLKPLGCGFHWFLLVRLCIGNRARSMLYFCC